jgi:Lipopolysaccharide-assembly
VSDRLPLIRRMSLIAVAGLVVLLPACIQDGHLCIAGYTTKPNYNTAYHTVRVPIFKNNTLRQGLEFDLTKAVVNEIEWKTPYKVVSCDEDADTELLGKITLANKAVINRNQLNEIREAETTLTVELVWRDLKTGEILSKPRKGPPPMDLQIPALPSATRPTGQDGRPLELPPGAIEPPTGTPEPLVGPPPVVLVTSLGHFIPELGQSITTAYQQNVKRLATQIVSLMEQPW